MPIARNGSSAVTPFTIVAGDFVLTGGMDRANYALADFLARRGHPLHLVAHRTAPELLQFSTVVNRAVAKPLGSYFLGQWPLLLQGRAVARSVHAAGGRVVSNGGNCDYPDVNWVHYVHAAFRPPVVSTRLRDAKQWVANLANVRSERRALRAARFVICNSDRTCRDVIEKVGVDPKRAVTVYLGIDPTRFRPADEVERARLRESLGWPMGRPIVLFMGGLGDRRKGFDTLFLTWSQLCKQSDWNAMLVVIGRGAELPQWQERTRDDGLVDRIRYLGLRSDVPDLLRAADALISPTRYDAYGLGVHEALCCGLPAIVSASAGVAERYPADLAEFLLPDPDDATDLAARLRYWHDHRCVVRERFRPLRDQLRAYSWDDMSRAFLNAIGVESHAR